MSYVMMLWPESWGFFCFVCFFLRQRQTVCTCQHTGLSRLGQRIMFFCVVVFDHAYMCGAVDPRVFRDKNVMSVMSLMLRFGQPINQKGYSK